MCVSFLCAGMLGGWPAAPGCASSAPRAGAPPRTPTSATATTSSSSAACAPWCEAPAVHDTCWVHAQRLRSLQAAHALHGVRGKRCLPLFKIRVHGGKCLQPQICGSHPSPSACTDDFTGVVRLMHSSEPTAWLEAAFAHSSRAGTNNKHISSCCLCRRVLPSLSAGPAAWLEAVFAHRANTHKQSFHTTFLCKRP